MFQLLVDSFLEKIPVSARTKAADPLWYPYNGKTCLSDEPLTLASAFEEGINLLPRPNAFSIRGPVTFEFNNKLELKNTSEPVDDDTQSTPETQSAVESAETPADADTADKQSASTCLLYTSPSPRD